MKARVHVLVSGEVQGVFFRAHTRDRANSLGVAGWVRNLSDGKVEAVFEGEENDVNEMVELCRKGPEGAIVDKIEIKRERFRNEFRSFDVRF